MCLALLVTQSISRRTTSPLLLNCVTVLDSSSPLKSAGNYRYNRTHTHTHTHQTDEIQTVFPTDVTVCLCVSDSGWYLPSVPAAGTLQLGGISVRTHSFPVSTETYTSRTVKCRHSTHSQHRRVDSLGCM